MEIVPSSKPVAVEIKGADGKTYYCSGGNLITPEAKERIEQYREQFRKEAAERSATRRQQAAERKKRSQFQAAAPALVKALEAKLARLDWRPVAAGRPTEEDAGGAGGIDVEWSDGLDIWQGFWYSGHQRRNATHWRPINLPPIITP